MDQLDIRLSTMVYGGEVMSRLPDGRAVFVPYALPGEKVRIELTEEKRGHARARLVEVLEPSDDRITPLCPHYTRCGGCHYQHLGYAGQLAAKAAILCEQLERIGGLHEVTCQAAVASPQPWNYRNHVQFHLTPEAKLGYQAPRSNTVIPIQECHLPEPALNEIWPQIELEPLPGLERVNLRVGMNDDLLLILESSQPEPFEFSVEDLPISAVHLGPTGAVVLAGSDYLTMCILDRPFQVSAASFFQVNTGQAELMVKHLLDNLRLPAGATLLDVYCGVGLFSAFLAPAVSRLVGIELSPQACEDFAVNLDEFEHVELYEASAEDVLISQDFHPDVLVVDPPRAGLGQRTLDGLLAQNAPQIAYISCDPSTLARDARRLVADGYHLRQITPFDLFPHTFHIESLSFWDK
jgi:23S rRNA (uracil1939-C5)-methyltransferase